MKDIAMMQPFFSKNHSSLYLLLLPFLFLFLIFFAVYPNDLKLQSFFSTCVNLLRLVYSKSMWPTNNVTDYVDVRFVMCNIMNEDHITMVALKIMNYSDIIVLNCTENINTGKTYNYFSSLPNIFSHDAPYDYVMKTDDDTYLRLNALVESLRNKPRNDVYYGLEIPCNGTKFNNWLPAPFMTGLGYVLSWDLVEWIAMSEVPVNHTIGPEDMMTGWWMKMGEKGKNRYNNAPVMYDFRGPEEKANCFCHNLITDTVAVYRLKENSRWTTVLNFFNVTHGIKPSKLHNFC
ncbi:beta-1,3-galactosyltransferase pvg3-like [Carex rostrata]